jgi:6-phosphogluconate dehydrogenase (decarboxylating)
MPVVTMALFARFRARAHKGGGTFGEKLLAALRDEFGVTGIVKE